MSTTLITARPSGAKRPESLGAASTQRLLVVDDDEELRDLLAEQLRGYGFDVATAGDGVEMWRQLEQPQAIDLIVLDINLPGDDGIILCRRLQTLRKSPPVIMLTARSEPIDRIVGLEMGADDYLTKPFEPRELLARIRSVLRRSSAPTGHEQPPSRKAFFDDWALDLEHRRLEAKDGRLVILSGAEYRLLRALVENSDRVLSREELRTIVSPQSNDTLDRAIDLQISRLRTKLGGADLIHTIRRQGYIIAAPVRFA